MPIHVIGPICNLRQTHLRQTHLRHSADFVTLMDMISHSIYSQHVRHIFVCLALLVATGCSPENKNSTLETPPTATKDLTTDSTATPMRMTDDAFRFAAYEGKVELLKEGLEAGNDVNAADPEKRLTPLHMAAYNGHSLAVQFLIDNGATVDARDSEGKTALLHACTGPFVETVRLLLASGADVNAAESTEAFTPLMMAAGLGEVEVVKLLLEYRATTETLDDDGDSALKHAQNSGHAQIVELLEKR